MIKFFLLVNKQGQTRICRYYTDISHSERSLLEGELVRLCLQRSAGLSSFLEFRDYRIVYRRYASLFFIVGCDEDENEMAVHEMIHHVVETFDRHFDRVITGVFVPFPIKMDPYEFCGLEIPCIRSEDGCQERVIQTMNFFKTAATAK